MAGPDDDDLPPIEEDELEALIAKGLGGDTDEEEDADPYSPPEEIEAGDPDVIGERDALRRLDYADPDAPAKADDTANTGADAGGEEAARAEPDPLEGLTEQQRARLEPLVNNPVVKLFEGRKDLQEAFGGDAHSVAARLVELQDYARTNPVEYVGWLAQQIGERLTGDDGKPLGIDGVLQQARRRALGDQAEATDADDEFLTDDERRLRDENRQLREQLARAGGANTIGPDSREAQTLRAIQDWAAETDQDGRSLRPRLEELYPVMQETVIPQWMKRNGGKPPTLDDLHSIYQAAASVADTLAAGGVVAGHTGPSGASRPAPNAAVERSRRASMDIGGSGPRAPRHPPRHVTDDVEGDLRRVAERLGFTGA